MLDVRRLIWRKGDLDKAATDAETALRIDPNDTEARKWLKKSRQEKAVSGKKR